METARQIAFRGAVSSHRRSISDACLIIGRHGALYIVEVRDERGRKALRYVHD
jgi:hypothetical protein